MTKRGKELAESDKHKEKLERLEQFAERRGEVQNHLRRAHKDLRCALENVARAEQKVRALEMDVAAAREYKDVLPQVKDAVAQIPDCWETPDGLTHEKELLSGAISDFELRTHAYLADGFNDQDYLANFSSRDDRFNRGDTKPPANESDPMGWFKLLVKEEPSAALASRKLRETLIADVREDELPELFRMSRILTDARTRMRNTRQWLISELACDPNAANEVLKTALRTIEDNQLSIRRALLLDLHEQGFDNEILAEASGTKRGQIPQILFKARRDRKQETELEADSE